MFQFLIGWLQTITFPLMFFNFSLFQFLIGWLQTKITAESKKKNEKKVSIPYRLATNVMKGSKRLSFVLFQFLIGWLQTKEGLQVEFEAYLCFNSL